MITSRFLRLIFQAIKEQPFVGTLGTGFLGMMFLFVLAVAFEPETNRIIFSVLGLAIAIDIAMFIVWKLWTWRRLS